MKLPKKIKVGPWTFKVESDRNGFNYQRLSNGEPSAIGFCSTQDQTIYIDPELASDMKADTLLHEVFHVIFYAAGGNNYYDKEEEEKIISFFTTYLLDVLRNNGTFTDFLLYGEDE